MTEHRVTRPVPAPLRRGADVPTTGARLQLAPSDTAPSRVDGLWWPRSTDLVGELPALLEAVHDRTGGVALVGFHRGAWDCTVSRTEVLGKPVMLEGFTDDEPHTVIVIGDSGRRLTLAVLAPGTA